jgi:hypothetical protein
LAGATIEKMQRNNRDFCFIIHSRTPEGNKDFILSTDTEELFNKWTQAINAAIQAVEEEESYVSVMTQ